MVSPQTLLKHFRRVSEGGKEGKENFPNLDVKGRYSEFWRRLKQAEKPQK